MPKDNDEGNKRVEGIFGQIGLGNQDCEKIPQFEDAYEKAMYTAEITRKRKGVKFRDVFFETEKTQEKKRKEGKPEAIEKEEEG